MIKFCRIDHRLLHGQVIFSWTKSESIERIIVIDDLAANDEFKKMSLSLSKPTGVKLNIFSVDTAIQNISKIKKLPEKVMLIFGNTDSTLKFVEVYKDIKEINYGGIPEKEGSKKFSNTIALTDQDIENSKALNNMGIELYMQQIPTTKREELNDKL
ncbi:PTS sorbose transporter subunit IIC [Companilactobacillus crustorum]|uniref:PTS mannose/fructose/sorbose transporter subunit IIB n=2 Tax=Companilactobacillus TaxID=2767879 RepID=A0A2P4R7X8_9LACO|nr:PTS sugar transporter subunit IIB [Companilactobacillus crustorum]WDT65714.1 PTS sugar transporter subunit IIB [Companilactobacillus crustorum]GEO75979.1 PTS sorbose transporter subunit IIC [Companilactobacillus crustorum]HCD08467.1 PTS mannose/fructose/sorbose transporter subunit IIB [Lactobacillus sp.]